jgi:hypothetical protein
MAFSCLYVANRSVKTFLNSENFTIKCIKANNDTEMSPGIIVLNPLKPKLVQIVLQYSARWGARIDDEQAIASLNQMPNSNF